MIGTIRKHSSWLWWLIAGLTIVSFVVFMGSGPARSGRNGGGGGSFGTLYGHELTGDEVAQAERDFYLDFFLNYGEWPDKDPSITPLQMEQRKYVNLLFEYKAKSMGIAIPDDVVADAAAQMLRSRTLARIFGTPNEAVPMDKFVSEVLTPRGFTVADFQHALRSQLIVEQLEMVLGLSGTLVTPQEAATLYDRENQEVSAQAVFFSASNYLDQVPAPPSAVGQFYTNYMSYYRVPDRIQVSYVWFNITNYLAGAKAELAKTNIETTVDRVYAQYGATQFKDAKTPEEAKAQIRDLIIKDTAKKLAVKQAEDFKTALYAMDPVKPENLLTLAQQQGLAGKISAPFAAGSEPDEFANAPAVVKAAFTLSTDSPFSDLIGGDDGIYIIGLGNQLPSSIPSLDEIHARVEQDFRMQSAIALANQAGTNFYLTATVQMAVGKTFAQAAINAGHTPVVLSPFSLSSDAVPEATGRVSMPTLKQAAFSTEPGHVSRYISSGDGGLVLYVQKVNPPDMTKRTAELPGFLSQMRRGRQNEAFNLWVNSEANREFRNIPALAKPQTDAPGQP